MEDAAGAFDRWPNGSGVDEVHLEEPETRVGAAHGLQVLRLALIFCSERFRRQTEFDATRRAGKGLGVLSQHRNSEVSLTEVLDGGVDGVAAVKEAADEPGANEAAGARHADDDAAVPGCRHFVAPALVAWPGLPGCSS